MLANYSLQKQRLESPDIKLGGSEESLTRTAFWVKFALECLSGQEMVLIFAANAQDHRSTRVCARRI
jgi:hypothetical protein